MSDALASILNGLRPRDFDFFSYKEYLPEAPKPARRFDHPSFAGRCTPRSRVPHDAAPRTSVPANALAVRYGFPKPKPGQRVAFISLGGGLAKPDLAAYCKHYGIAVPDVRWFPVGGATNRYTGDPNSADLENALDLQNIVGASGGQAGADVYFAPNSDAGILAALDAILAGNAHAAVSMSWGAAESKWSLTTRREVNGRLQKLAALGVPFFCASGDDGSGDGLPGNNVDFPASSPDGIGCGGTTITASDEAAWGYGGGGYSIAYPAPDFQKGGGVPGIIRRGVPDVAGSADPNSGSPVYLNGKWYTVGGTSAVAPLWAAYVACLVSVRGSRLFDLAKMLYQLKKCRDITRGKNGAFSAAAGWDPCTGLGVPSQALTDALLAQAPPPPKPVVPNLGAAGRIEVYDSLNKHLGTISGSFQWTAA